ncbi:MAG: heme exporter protein CcmB [Firmicutes bacterium]|nr:heme exporter protein CcmB [Bacillota bacterium]
MTIWRAVWTMARKDVAIEARGKALYLAAVSYGALTVILLGFSVGQQRGLPASWASGTLWLVEVLAALTSFTRLEDKERWDGGAIGAMAAPVDRSAVFFARVLGNLLFVYAVECVTIPLFLWVLGVGWPVDGVAFVLAVLLGTVAFVSLGTFLTAVVAASSLREILAPVLLMPLAVPLFLALVSLTAADFSPPDPFFHASVWWVVLAGYAGVFLVLPGLLFEIIVEV